MLCYRDMTFCNYWMLCKNGHTCNRALTDKIKQDAEKWWGEPAAPISVYSGYPDCFARWFEGGEDARI